MVSQFIPFVFSGAIVAVGRFLECAPANQVSPDRAAENKKKIVRAAAIYRQATPDGVLEGDAPVPRWLRGLHTP